MPRQFKVHELLKDEPQTLRDLEAFATRGRTVDEVHEWLQAKGFTLGRTAVWTWLDSFRLEDSTRRASEVSTAYLQAAADTDDTAVAAATLKKFQELVFDFVVRQDQADAGDLLKIAVAMRQGLGSQKAISDLKAKQAEAIKAAEAAVTTGASAGDVVATIKKALGIAA